jgi:hypothetical protein
VTPTIVTINNTTTTSTSALPNGTATANQPGATVITASVSKVTSSAGYFYTCPPASIGLTIDGGTSATITAGNPQNIVASVPDTTGAFITGLSLDYTSTQPQEIAVGATGALSSSFPGAAAVTAICQPGTCNPAPINKIGTYGTGLPIVSNRLNITSPGTGNTLLWASSPQSQYFTPFDLSLGTVGSPIRLPYPPNSMLLDQAGNNLYFGSYRELMIYSVSGNSPSNGLSKEDTTVPGVVLAVSPDSTTVVIDDQLRQVIYLYTVSTGGNISIGGLATRAVYSPDGKNVYIVGPTTLYVHNSTTGWSTYPLTSSVPTDATCTFTNNAPGSGAFNPYCSPDVAISVPAVSPFISGTETTARSFCQNNNVTPPYYPQAATIAAPTDHLAVTNDGAHLIGATAATLVDIEHAPTTDTDRDLVPTGTCPAVTSANPVTLTTTVNQLALSGITPTQIDQVLASPNSSQIFLTYAASTATGLVPLYRPSSTAGAPGTLSYVQLASGAQAPVAGVFSPDISTLFVSTSGDNLIHQLSTGTLTDGQTLNPQLRDADGNVVPAQYLVVKPRPTS